MPGHVLLMAFAAALALLTGAAGTLALDVRGRAAGMLSALTLAAASVIAPALALSLVDELRLGPWLAGQALLATAAVIGAGRRGRRGRRGRPPRVALHTGLRAAARAHPAIAVLVVAAGAGMAFQAANAVLVAPQNWDAMAYHLSKAAYWLQFDSATQFPNGTWRELYTPPNAELLMAWTMEMLDTDRVAQLVQWVAGVACGLAVHVAARELGARREHAVFAGALFVALPQPLLQSATAQNDLVVTAFVAAAAIFLVRGLRDRHGGELVVAGIAAGLAVGTKGTAFVVAPGLAVVVAAVLYRHRPPRRVVLSAVAALVAGVVVLGAFNWVLSIKNTGHPAPSVVSDTTVAPGPNGAGRSVVDPYAANAGNVLWQFADLPGVRVAALDRLLAKPVRTTFGDRYARRSIPLVIGAEVNEDRSAYGAVGFALLFPVLLLAAFGRAADRRRRVLALGSLVALGVYLLFIAANPFVGRVLLPWVAMTAPLLAILATRPAWRALTVALALFSLVPVVLLQDYRAVVPDTGESMLARGRLQQYEVSRWPMGSAIDRLTDVIGDTAPIGFVGENDSWDYPFFGPHLERRVLRLPPDQATPQRLRAEGLAAIVFADVGPPPRGFRRTPLAEGIDLARLP